MKVYKYFYLLFLITISCDDIVGIEDISDKTVNVIAPSNGVTIPNGLINFSWDEVNDATRYKLQIATPSFDSATQVVKDTIIEVTNLSISLDINEYEWRVRAENTEYTTAYTTQSFTVN